MADLMPLPSIMLRWTMCPGIEAILGMVEGFEEMYEAGEIDADEFPSRMSCRFCSHFPAGATVEDFLKSAAASEQTKNYMPEHACVVAYELNDDRTGCVYMPNVPLSSLKDKRIFIKKDPTRADTERIKRALGAARKRKQQRQEQ